MLFASAEETPNVGQKGAKFSSRRHSLFNQRRDADVKSNTSPCPAGMEGFLSTPQTNRIIMVRVYIAERAWNNETTHASPLDP
jgi:hypothetical protein